MSTVGPSRGGTSLILCNCGSVHWVLTQQAGESLALRNGEYVRSPKKNKKIQKKEKKQNTMCTTNVTSLCASFVTLTVPSGGAKLWIANARAIQSFVATFWLNLGTLLEAQGPPLGALGRPLDVCNRVPVAFGAPFENLLVLPGGAKLWIANARAIQSFVAPFLLNLGTLLEAQW